MPNRARQTRPADTDVSAETPKLTAVPDLPTLDALADAPATLSELRREPNPLAGAARASLNSERPKMLAVVNDEQAKKVTALIRRDATENQLGLSIDTKTLDGQMYVVFRAKTEKRKMAASTKDIREWAREQNPPLPVEMGDGSSRLPFDTRQAYRKAHGLPETTQKAKKA